MNSLEKWKDKNLNTFPRIDTIKKNPAKEATSFAQSGIISHRKKERESKNRKEKREIRNDFIGNMKMNKCTLKNLNIQLSIYFLIFYTLIISSDMMFKKIMMFFSSMRILIWETLCKMFVDVVAIVLSFALAYYFRLFTFSHSLFPFDEYMHVAYLVVPVWIIFLGASGRYALSEKSMGMQFQQIFFASLSSSLLFPLVFYFSNNHFFSRGIILLLFVLSVTFLLTVSVVEKKISRWKTSMLIIGANRDAERIIEALQKSSSRHIPTAVLAPYGSKKKELLGVVVAGKLDALERVVEQFSIDEIFMCEGIEHSENIASFCRNKGIPLKISVESLGMNNETIDSQVMGGTVFLTMQQSPLFGWGQFFKRLFDILVASVGLFLFSPILLWNWKKLVPVTFQRNSSETFIAYCIPRKKGYALLKWTLLYNVLKKDISMVGPRLFLSEEYRLFFSSLRAGKQARTLLRSGIFSPSSDLENPSEVLKTDIAYIQNWSFWNDLMILLKGS